MSVTRFQYDQAFSRNLGLIQSEEQLRLRCSRVAIAGLGGVGGVHLTTLARMGIANFHLADFDHFELHNLNRQVGARLSTMGRLKIDVMADMVRDINPETMIRTFPEGLHAGNIDEFLTGVDVAMDGLDYFAVEARSLFYAAAYAHGIPVVTAGPIGCSAAFLVFVPGGMTWHRYFAMDLARDELDRYILFLIGTAPKATQMSYVDRRHVDLAEKRGPSLSQAVHLCAGVAAAEAMKLLLGRGNVLAAPHYRQLDAYTNQYVMGKLRWGNRGPLQRLKLRLVRRMLEEGRREVPRAAVASASDDTRPETGTTRLSCGVKPYPRPIEAVLDLARWAPSGDNTQPWRFEIADDRRLIVHGWDTRSHCVYDLTGQGSRLSLGALLETIVVAATGWGWRTSIVRDRDTPDHQLRFHVSFEPQAGLRPDPLLPTIRQRSVHRGPLRCRRLTDDEKRQLDGAVAPPYRLSWLEGWSKKLAMTRLLFDNAGLRLTLPEAYPTHKAVIRWDADHSHDRIPDRALGASRVTLGIMKWAMQSWNRVAFLNRYAGGTVLPRLEMDVIPALACAAHYAIVVQRPVQTVDASIEAGRMLQRFWLTATRLGLYVQPEMTPLIFAAYAREGVPFSDVPGMRERAHRIARRLEHVMGPADAAGAVFLGRIGAGTPPRARSLRKALAELTATGGAGKETAPDSSSGATGE